MRLARPLALLAVFTACARVTLPPTGSHGQMWGERRDATLYSAADSRKRLVGDWAIEFSWDARRRSTRGALQIRDSSVRFGLIRASAARMDIEVERTLRWRPPCFYPELDMIEINVVGDSLDLNFSPTCFDNNWYARVGSIGDTLKGSWTTMHFAGEGPVRGTFRMWRR